MNNLLKFGALSICTLTMTVSLTACGGGGSSSGPSTVPNSATVFYAHNLVFRNSTTFATGYNGFGQLGTGNLVNRTTFGAVKAEHGYRGVATGGDHSVAFFNNSTVHTWGYNGFGQLGTNSTTFSNKPINVVRQGDIQDSYVSLSNVVQVAAGSMHSLALCSDGTVWAWGENTYGQVGMPTTGANGKNEFIKYAVPVMVAGAPLKNIVAIAANGHFSLALDSAGTVWAWGLNGSGQIGVDPLTTGAKSEPTSVAFPVPTAIVAIAAGGASAYAIDTEGKLWVWGNNFNGQLCIGSKDDTSTPTPVSALQAKVVQVSAGIQHVLVRLADTSLWACGYDIYGQLGDNDKKNKQDKIVPVQVLAADGATFFTDAIDIRAFGSSSMAKTSAGWFVWGDNTFGQLGTGGKGTVMLPEKLSGF